MWKEPYSYKEGFVISGGLVVSGLMLQLSVGPLIWDIFMWPANIIALAVFIVLLALIWLLRSKSYFFRFITTAKAAVPAISTAVVMTVIMGLTKQTGEKNEPADLLGFTKMLECWSFILIYIWMTVIVGEETIKQIATFRLRGLPSLLSHAGLFVVLTCGTLGSADMQRLRMYCEQGKPEWRGLDAWNNVHELPVAIELEKFTIDEYPPKLMVVDNEGKPLPIDKPDILEVEGSNASGTLAGFDISVLRRIDNAMPAALARMAEGMPAQMLFQIRMDSLRQALNKDGYVLSSAPGSECALLVKAQPHGTKSLSGWVTCGSYQFRYQGLSLDSLHTLVMATREPKQYSSLVDVYTKKGESLRARIEVNRPLKVDGWNIYQLSYDQQMGKWSTLSVFELVSDPWLPVVYIGIFLLAIGAVGMFFIKRPTT